MVDRAPLRQDLPVGFRFCPTDEELVGHFLRHKLMADGPSIHFTIPEIDVCKYEPWELPAAVSAFSLIKSDDPQWFFFTRRDYKYSNSSRSNRATSCGYWKATGKDRNIRDLDTNNVIGTKKTLVFYQRHVPRIKTNWVIHEYHDAIFHPNQRTHVVCKLLKKPEKKTEKKMDEVIYDESEPNDAIATECENLANGYMIPKVHYFSHMDFQTPLKSDDLGGSMTQTRPEVDSTNDDESEEFDYKSFLLWSPIRDEKE